MRGFLNCRFKQSKVLHTSTAPAPTITGVTQMHRLFCFIGKCAFSSLGRIYMDIDYLNPNVVYFSANGAMPNNTSGGSMYKVLALGILVDTSTGLILDEDINMVTELSVRFICSQLKGANIDSEWDIILKRFDRLQIPAQRSVIVALKAVREKYQKYINYSKNSC